MFGHYCVSCSWSSVAAEIVPAATGGKDRAGHPPRRYPATTAEPNKAVTDYPLRGVVKKVEPELDHLTIQHEAIPGFMDAMRMRFAYKDKAVLDKLKPGD